MALPTLIDKNRRRLLYATAVVLAFSAGLRAEPDDSAPQLLSTTGGNKNANWKNLAELKKAAEAHNPQACAQYGEALLRGVGVKQDTAQALLYLREAANGGEANAAFRLGKIYESGEATPQDYGKAFEYYATAAKAGVYEAQYNLGAMYVSARGVKRDYVEGLAWLIVAQKNGAPDDGEKEVRERLQKSKRQQQITEAELRAAEIIKDPAAALPSPDTPTTPPAPITPAPQRVEIGATNPVKINLDLTAPPLPDLPKPDLPKPEQQKSPR